jgi:hypothetical protein
VTRVTRNVDGLESIRLRKRSSYIHHVRNSGSEISRPLSLGVTSEALEETGGIGRHASQEAQSFSVPVPARGGGEPAGAYRLAVARG